eukprot:scaffold10818_cov22-Cyclotella_meneghiniana.AAC.2
MQRGRPNDVGISNEFEKAIASPSKSKYLSPCKTAAVGSAKEILNELCGIVQVEFHPTWVPIMYGVEFKGKKQKFLTGRTNWNNSYDLESCIQMTHNYSGSKIPLNDDNPHMPSGRRDLV